MPATREAVDKIIDDCYSLVGVDREHSRVSDDIVLTELELKRANSKTLRRDFLSSMDAVHLKYVMLRKSNARLQPG